MTKAELIELLNNIPDDCFLYLYTNKEIRTLRTVEHIETEDDDFVVLSWKEVEE
jgi:hypothetical protein